MATINLGAIKFNWKGSYSGATAYVVDDVVESSGSSYICIAATTGNAPPNASYWEQMSAKGIDGTNGTNGTDLTTTLTTQGDIVYRDASGLARLPAGSANQVLQSGGAGANPSWVDASGGATEKLSTVSFSSVTQVTVDGLSTYFGSTPSDYLYYRIVTEFTDLTGTPAITMYMRLMVSNSVGANSRYNWTLSRNESNSAGSTTVVVGEAQNEFRLNVDGIRGNNDYSHYMTLDVFNLNDNSSQYKYLQYTGKHSWVQHDSDCRVHTNYIGGNYNSSNTDNTNYTGLQFFPSSGNFSGKIHIYGVKA
jgi:hypothetical protein